MSCFLHSDRQNVANCKVCNQPLCDECCKFQESFGGCPKCSKNKLQNVYNKFKNGLIFNILSVACFVAFLTIYLVTVFTNAETVVFIVLGAVGCVLLGAFSITLFVRTLVKICKLKKFLNK